MNELKLIEKELVPVYETNTGEKVVNGRELWEVLKVKSRFNDCIKERFNDVEAIKNVDFITFTENLVKGRPANNKQWYTIKRVATLNNIDWKKLKQESENSTQKLLISTQVWKNRGF